LKPESSRAALVRRIDRYITPVLTAVCSFAFFDLVPLMPGAPVLPALAAAALGIYSTRKPKRAAIVFYLLAYTSVIWQFVGFGLLDLIAQPVGTLVAFLILAPLLANFMNPRMSPSSIAIAFLAVAVMLTPYYLLAIPLIAAAVVLDGFGSVSATVSTYILTLAPLLLVENGLYYASLPNGATGLPIIFGQLVRVAADIRPALPGLNVFVTGLPADFVSVNSPQIVGFLVDKSYVMVIPLAVFAIVFTTSVSLAGILTTLKGKLYAFVRLSRTLKLVWPMVVTTVTTTAFVALLLVLSSADLGGYQVAFNQGPAYVPVVGMVGVAAFMGAALAAREALNESLVSVTAAKEQLEQTLEEARNLIASLTRITKKVSEFAPSVGLRVEEQVLKEYSSYVSDVKRQIDTSGAQALNTWEGDLQARIIPTLRSFPEQVRVKVVNEVSSIVSVSASLNTTLEHVGVDTRFPSLGYEVASLDTEKALEAYAAFTTELSSKVSELYRLYLTAAKALDQLLDKTVSEPPVNPDALLDAHDFVTVLRLLGEEYSMNLHAAYHEELAQKAGELSEKLRMLAKGMGASEGRALERAADFGEVRPLDSPRLLAKVNECIQIVLSTVSEAVDDSERLATMVGTLMPAAATVLKFETLAELDKLKALRKEARALKPVLAEVALFTDEMRRVLEGHKASETRDEENLIMIAQYPLAARLIKELAAGKSVVSISELPFQPDAAHLYARIYAANEYSARYDEQSEALLITNA
jgi:hypothetical protein